MNEQIKEIIYQNHRPRLDQIVQKIDNCWNNNNKKGMEYYINYIQNTIDFIEGGEIKCVKI